MLHYNWGGLQTSNLEAFIALGLVAEGMLVSIDSVEKMISLNVTYQFM